MAENGKTSGAMAADLRGRSTEPPVQWAALSDSQSLTHCVPLLLLRLLLTRPKAPTGSPPYTSGHVCSVSPALSLSLCLHLGRPNWRLGTQPEESLAGEPSELQGGRSRHSAPKARASLHLGRSGPVSPLAWASRWRSRSLAFALLLAARAAQPEKHNSLSLFLFVQKQWSHNSFVRSWSQSAARLRGKRDGDREKKEEEEEEFARSLIERPCPII